ncbi:MAG: bifunctional 4'-phosphopantothenoylcysteine decarboxylase/phosphopantothenoylcysteine synthetase, partial [Clostridia bacterium]|nr:bifunctional 4'-phosphopantothenoylcysteine decarboxylase/phosphopantothenoylcysteine synthetase [Clostridia bacterium]
IVLGVAAGVAAYKAVGVASRLRQRGAAVFTVLSPRATAFVQPLSFEAVTGQPCYVDVTASSPALVHVELADTCDGVVVAPATADLLGRAAAGLADDLLTTVLLAVGQRVPVVVAPAMNHHMWHNPLVQRNVGILRDLGWRFVGPVFGHLAEGYQGDGRLAPEDAVVDALAEALASVPSPRIRPGGGAPGGADVPPGAPPAESP